MQTSWQTHAIYIHLPDFPLRRESKTMAKKEAKPWPRKAFYPSTTTIIIINNNNSQYPTIPTHPCPRNIQKHRIPSVATGPAGTHHDLCESDRRDHPRSGGRVSWGPTACWENSADREKHPKSWGVVEIITWKSMKQYECWRFSIRILGWCEKLGHLPTPIHLRIFGWYGPFAGRELIFFFGCHTPILKDPLGLVQMFTVSVGQSPNKNSGDQFLVIWRMDTGNNVSRWEAGNFRENFRRCKLLTPWDSYTDLHLSDKHKYKYDYIWHTHTHIYIYI